MLQELRQKYYNPNLTQKVTKFFNNCEWCLRAKDVRKETLLPPLQQIYDPCDGPEDLMEIDLVGELPNSNGYTYILTACDVFTRYLFAVPLRHVDSQSVIKALTGIFTQHAYVPKGILTDKGSVTKGTIQNIPLDGLTK